MSEELLVRHCAPTLAGLKTANLFACRFSDGDALRRCLCCWNRRLMKKGLRILPLRFEGRRALIYVYRPARLACDLRQVAACPSARGTRVSGRRFLRALHHTPDGASARRGRVSG